VIYPQDRYGSQEDLVRILKMHNEVLVKARGLKPTLLRESSLNKFTILRTNPLISEFLDDYKEAMQRNYEKF
jgi:hypothetical protein